MKKILVIHTKYRITGGEDIAVEIVVVGRVVISPPPPPPPPPPHAVVIMTIDKMEQKPISFMLKILVLIKNS